MTERRRDKRYTLRDGSAYTLVHPPANKIGGVIDISFSGLAFSYFSIDGKKQNPDRIDILSDGDLVLEDIPCETVNEFAIPNEQPFSLITMRRCCIKFGPLSTGHREQIQSLIDKYGSADN
jgi:hypothetical protein